MKITPDFSEADEILLHNYIRYIDSKRRGFDWNLRSLRQGDMLSLAHFINVTPDTIGDKLEQIIRH